MTRRGLFATLIAGPLAKLLPAKPRPHVMQAYQGILAKYDAIMAGMRDKPFVPQEFRIPLHIKPGGRFAEMKDDGTAEPGL